MITPLFRSAMLYAAILVAGQVPVGAQDVDGRMPVPRHALTVLGVPWEENRAFAMLRAIRVLHAAPRPDAPPSEIVAFERLLLDIDHAEREASRAGSRGLSLAMAQTATERSVLRDALEAIGLRLREQRRTFAVEPHSGRTEGQLRTRLIGAGIDSAAIAKRLNAGETVTVSADRADVPLLLPSDVWTAAVFEQPTPPARLFSAIVRDRRASLLYYGLQSMTASTRMYLTRTPELLRAMYSDAGAVAAFGGAFRVDAGGRVLVPGGRQAEDLWEDLVGESVSQPERFGRTLFGRDGGRLAYFVDTLWALDEPHRQFALGLGAAGRTRNRSAALRDLYSVFVQTDPEWTVSELPFLRPPHDTGLLLSLSALTTGGDFAGPAYRKLWSRGVESNDIPDPDDRQMREPDEDGLADAAFLAGLLAGKLPPARRLVVERIAFAQRNFLNATPDEMQGVLVALRAYGRFRGLMLTLDRIGIRSARIYEQATRQARAIEAQDPSRAVPLLAQFQGALALLERLVRTGAVASASVDELVASLCALRLAEGRYDGRLAAWVFTRLMPVLPPSLPGATLEARVLNGLLEHGQSPSAFSWEGESYVVDFTADGARLQAARTKQGGTSLDVLRTVYEHLEALAREGLTLADIAAQTKGLRSAAAALTAGRPWPDIPDEVPNVKRAVDEAVRDLNDIRRDRDVVRSSRIARELTETIDYLLGETLTALAYLPAVDDASRTAASTDLSHRHLFGFATINGDEGRLVPWRRPARGSALVEGDALTGSLFGIDVALAHRRLRRLSSTGLPEAPRLTPNDSITMTEAVPLLNPRMLSDTDRDRIGESVERGRARVAAAAGDPLALDALAAEASIAPSRRELLRWTALHHQAESATMFSMAELFALGGGARTGLDPWGTAHESVTGCYCVSFPDEAAWPFAVGRASTGSVAARFGGLNIRIATLLSELDVPASLFPIVMAFATQEYIETVPAVHADDWAALHTRAMAMTRERVEDYVSAIVANGPVRREDPK